MVRFLFFLLTLVALSDGLHAQLNYVKWWDRKYGGAYQDLIMSIKATQDGKIILAGSSQSDSSGDKTQPLKGGQDFWILKIDDSGNKIWDRDFGSTGGEALQDVELTNDGGYIVSGTIVGNANGDITEPSRGDNDYWMIKIDSDGNKQWDKRFGGAGTEYMMVAKQTIDSGYIVGGSSWSGISGDRTQSSRGILDFWVIKTDALGNKQWDKRFGTIGFDYLNDVSICSNGGYVLVGGCDTCGGGDVSQGALYGRDGWIIKIDKIGNKLWDKTYGGNGTDEIIKILETQDHGFILGVRSTTDSTGDKTTHSRGNFDYWLIKTDSMGEKIWEKDYGSQSVDEIQSLIQTTGGGYLIGGYAGGEFGDKTEFNLAGEMMVWLVKTDSMGNKVWDKTFNTKKMCWGGYVLQADDSCYLVGVMTESGIGYDKTVANWDTTNTTDDFWVIKFCDGRANPVGISAEVAVDEGGIQIQIWPNPFSSDLSIVLKGENIHEATFTITNALGQVIYKREENNLSSNYTKMLDLSYLPNGVYFIAVTINGETTAKRVVKQ